MLSLVYLSKFLSFIKNFRYHINLNRYHINLKIIWFQNFYIMILIIFLIINFVYSQTNQIKFNNSITIYILYISKYIKV